MLFILLTVVGVATGGAELGAHDGKRIAAIDYHIDGAVKVEALRRNMRLKTGDMFDARVWADDVQQLMNRGVFAAITTRATETKGGVRLDVTARTTWSLLPYIGGQSGAVPILMLGANYANVAGELVEAGGYYMRRGPYDLGRMWLVLPNVASHGSLLDIEMVMTGELVLDYPSSLGILDGLEDNYANPERYRFTVPERGVEVLRRGVFVDYGYQAIPEWLLLSLRHVLLFETSYRLPNVRAVFDAGNRSLPVPSLARSEPDKTRLSALSLTAITGRIDLIDNYRYRGREGRVVVTTASAATSSERDFLWLYASYRHHLNIYGDLDLGVRLSVAHTEAKDRRDQLSLGSYTLEPYVYNERNPGIMTIRGFRESQFHGQNLYFFNVEPRYVLFHDLQVPAIGGVSLTLAAYVDGGHAWQDSRDTFSAWYGSAGGGALISLKNFRYTFINWYYAHTFRPYAGDLGSIVLSRAFF